MGLWDNTAYLRCADLDRVQAALAELFAAEGRVPVDKPAPRVPAPWDSMQYGTGDDCPLWAVALIPGVAGWTVIKTAPFELLCEIPRGEREPRLAGLTRALGADGFQLNLYDGDSLVLLEASAGGEVALSGFAGHSDDPTVWNDMPIGDRLEAEFSLIEVGPAVASAVKEAFSERAATVVQAVLADGEVDNTVQVSSLIPHHELAIAGARACYFR